MSTGSKAKHATPKRYYAPADDDPQDRIAELLRESEAVKATIDAEFAAAPPRPQRSRESR